MDYTELSQKIDILITELDKNTSLNKELLKRVHENNDMIRVLINLLNINNQQTKNINDWVNIQLSPEQNVKNFFINTAANIVGNAIAVPTVINTKPLLGEF